jgi:glycosyltransferase involved in cell wall biosynthesis
VSVLERRPTLDPIIDAPLIGPRILFLVGDESGCSLWRVWQPTRYLRLHGYPCDWAHLRDPGMGDVPLGAYEAVVFCRLAWHSADRRGARRWLDGLKARGTRVFFEADDDLFTPFVVEQQLGRVNAEKTRRELEADREAALWVLSRCDGVTVSTQYLASTVRRYTSAPVEVVPNALDVEWFRAQQQGVQRTLPGPPTGCTIGWAGGNRPDADLEDMAVAWGRLARRYPDVTFVVMGHHPPVVEAHVPPERLVKVPWLHPDDYPKGLVGIDIGCCPLAETPFNRSKTSIKSWEFALSGAAVVASPTVYRQCVDGGRSGFVAETAGQWEEALAVLLRDEGMRRRMAGALKHDVLERWALGKNYWRWPLAWHRLMGGGG